MLSQSKKQKILGFFKGNIADSLDDKRLNEIASDCITGYEADRDHEVREEKKKKWEEGGKIARQVLEQKLDKGGNPISNTKLPVLAIAAIQFNARAYPAIVDGNTVCKPQIWGEVKADESEQPDPQKQAEAQQMQAVYSEKVRRAEDACEYQNWQLFNDIEGWETDTDNLLTLLSLYGEMYREIYYSKGKGKLCAEILTPETLIYSPSTTFEKAPRHTKEFTLYPHEIETKIRKGSYIEFEYDDDKEDPQEFIRQSCRIDLDDDGYPEPYLVTIHVDSSKVVLIEPNYSLDSIEANDDGDISEIVPDPIYVKYQFFTPLQGCGMGTGFFDVLYPLNDQINSTTNQINDAASQASMQGGFIDKGVAGRETVTLGRGEFKPLDMKGLDIRRSVWQPDFKDPSMALYQILTYFDQFAREVASTKEVLTGQQSVNASPTTTIAMIEQGLKVFSGIYKRIHRSLKEELILYREWNYRLLSDEQYARVIDADVTKEDFSGKDFDFIPVSDMSVVTEMQKSARAQFYMQFLGDPFFDQVGLRKDICELAGAHSMIPHLKTGMDPSEQERMMQMQLQMTQEQRMLAEAQNKAQELRVKTFEAETDRMGTRAKAVKDSAEARKTLSEIVTDRLRAGVEIEQIIQEVRSTASAQPQRPVQGIQ